LFAGLPFFVSALSKVPELPFLLFCKIMQERTLHFSLWAWRTNTIADFSLICFPIPVGIPEYFFGVGLYCRDVNTSARS
jgi:hypothetical protein